MPGSIPMMGVPPVLSIVLVVRRHQAYIRQCLQSILEQAPSDIDVVIVDDSSTDHGAQILEEIASADSRAHVHPLGEAHGLGASRDAGLRLARGKYVWFVDASDYLPVGALAAVATALAADPDVLVVEHVERDVFGEEPTGSPAGDAPYHLWNKVFRRDHLLSLGLQFGSAAFSEVRVTYPALLGADRVDELLGVAYCRRHVPPAVRRQWDDGSAFDVFEQYDRAFAFIAAHPRTQEGDRASIRTSMLGHYRALLSERPDYERREFFHQMSRSYRAHSAGAHDGAVTLVQRLTQDSVERGQYRTFQILQAATVRPGTSARRIRSASRLPRRGLVRARSWGLRRYYAAQLRRPMDDRLSVYAAYWYTAYACNPRAIYEKARELAPWLEGVWVVDADSAHALPPGVRHVIAGTHDYYRTMARAKYFINNVNFPNDIRKRPGQVHVQTHHGTPLKAMGMDLVDAPFSRARMNFPRLLNRVARWDFSISANSFSTEIWERVYPSGRYETLETGYPRNDVLANASAADTARLRAELGIEDGQKAVLYAPTHREYRSEFVPVLDVERLARELGPDFVILMRPHYFYASHPVVGGVGSSRVIDVAARPSIEELCVASDVLVTDYSSLMFDYAVLDRPIVIYAPDWAVYQTLRGVYFDLMAEPPGAVSVTEDELTHVLRSGRAWDDDSAQLRKVFRAKYCSLEDGRAAERVVRRLWPDADGPVPPRLLTTTADEEEERNGQRPWLRIVTTTPRPGRRGRAQRHESFHQHPGSGRFPRPPA